ncbi:MAG: GNAT family N-acetyltransferase [Pyrinomonadaceae bacterium]
MRITPPHSPGIMRCVTAITITQERPDAPDAFQLLSELDADLQRHPYPPESRHAFTVEQLLREQVAFFIARFQNEPVACGGIKMFSDYGEVKRMYVRPAHRGLGLGKMMLDHLGEHARAAGLDLLRLETGIYQVEAVRLYEGYGFLRRPPFGEYIENRLSVYLEKSLRPGNKTSLTRNFERTRH